MGSVKFFGDPAIPAFFFRPRIAGSPTRFFARIAGSPTNILTGSPANILTGSPDRRPDLPGAGEKILYNDYFKIGGQTVV